MSTKVPKLIACLVVSAMMIGCWWGSTRSSTASQVDLPTVLNARPDLLQHYLVTTAKDADKEKDKDKDKDKEDDDGGVTPPAGSSGTLGVKVNSFRSSNPPAQDCFPVSQGWDRYYNTQYWGGPFASPLIQFPNTGNVASVTIDTMHPSNGLSLVTGIVIVQNGTLNKVCATNVGPIVYPPNPNLSKATFAPTVNSNLYRVTIFYKSSTAGGLTNVFFNWSYP